MIKINLLANRPSALAANPSSGESLNEEIGVLRRRGFVNIFILLLPALAMYVWETQSIPEKQKKLSTIQQTLSEASDKNSRSKDIVAEIKKFKTEQELLQSQIDSLQKLSKDRLREIKILDVVQREIPEKVWLTKLEMNDVKITVSGAAATDADLISFMEVLSRNAYLKEVNLIKSVEETMKDIGAVKKFEVSGLLEAGQ